MLMPWRRGSACCQKEQKASASLFPADTITSIKQFDNVQFLLEEQTTPQPFVFSGNRLVSRTPSAARRVYLSNSNHDNEHWPNASIAPRSLRPEPHTSRVGRNRFQCSSRLFPAHSSEEDEDHLDHRAQSFRRLCFFLSDSVGPQEVRRERGGAAASRGDPEEVRDPPEG